MGQIIAKAGVVGVVGLGLTGLSCVRHLKQQGYSVVLADTRCDPPGLQECQAEFPELPIALGELTVEFLSQASELLVSPGVALSHPVLRELAAKGMPLRGDVDWFMHQLPPSTAAKVIAITGSNGKSTVASWLTHTLVGAGFKVELGGNIGVPVLEMLDRPTPDFYVLELSSFQLETCHQLPFQVATILNVEPDHMDRYNGFAEYVQAKQRIYQGAAVVVANREDPLSQGLVNTETQVIQFGQSPPNILQFGLMVQREVTYLAYGTKVLLAASELQVFGSHNWLNALAVLALCQGAGVSLDLVLPGLATFTGLPYRCQQVAVVQGVTYINDSKATNVASTVAAITGLSERFSDKTIVLLGGEGKGADFSPLRDVLSSYAKVAVLYGKDAQVLRDSFQGSRDALHPKNGDHEKMVPIHCEVVVVQNLSEAVTLAHSIAQSGDAVLLSPACASFDQFNSYEHRGDCFVREVQSLAVS